MFSSGCALIKTALTSMVSPSPGRDESHRHQNDGDEKNEALLQNITSEQSDAVVEDSIPAALVSIKQESGGNASPAAPVSIKQESDGKDDPAALVSIKQESDGNDVDAFKAQDTNADVETAKAIAALNPLVQGDGGVPNEAGNINKSVPVAPAFLTVPTDLNAIAMKPSPTVSQRQLQKQAQKERQPSQDQDQPNDSWGSTRTPEFLYQMTNMLTDKENKEVVEWVDGRIMIHNPPRLESDVLKKYFRHSKFASFQRQMNYFGFRKIAGKGKMAPCSYVHDSVTSDIGSLLCIKRKTNKWSMKAMERQREQQMQLLCSVNRGGPFVTGGNNPLALNSLGGGGLNPALGTGLPGLASAPAWPGLLALPGMVSPIFQQQTLNPLQQMQLQLHNQNMVSQLLAQNQLQIGQQLQHDQLPRDSEGRK